MAGPNRRALEETLREREADVPAVQVQLLRSLADAVDAEPAKAALWREYREALREVLGGEQRDGGLEAFLGELRGAEVGNTAQRQADART